MPKPIGILFTAVLLCGAHPARGVAIHAASMTAQLRITGFSDADGTPIAQPAVLAIEGDAELFDRIETTSGGATGTTSYRADVIGTDPLDLQLGDGIDLGAAASGDAAPPAPAEAEMLVATSGLLFLDNRSTTDIFRIDFELEYAWSLAASVGGPGESARADVTLLLETLSGGTVFSLFEEVIAGLGPEPRSDAATVRGELVLSPLDFDELGLVADSRGRASVPEPSTLALLAVASLISLYMRRDRAHRRMARATAAEDSRCAP